MTRFTLLGPALLVACATPPAAPALPPETPSECTARLGAFAANVDRMSDRTVAIVTRSDLPASTLGTLPGAGPLLDISPDRATIDGAALAGVTVAARAEALRKWAAPPSPGAVLYVAAPADTDVQTLRSYLGILPAAYELRLLVRAPKPSNGALGTAPDTDDAAPRILLEKDPQARRQIAEEAYNKYAECQPLTAAVASVHDRDPRARWPALKAALHDAVPRCDCRKVDTVHLKSVVTAEQRAGAGAVAYVPLSFLRDERCGASMPLRSMQKLVTQIERFDAEFAGSWQEDSLKFGDVVTNDRLRVYFCNALPGETLAAKERERATLFLKVPGQASCDPWRFEPLSPGAPMGTWRRVPGPSRPPLAYHYWQAAEELRVFGPADDEAKTKPTDDRKWTCEETHRLTAVDDDSLTSEHGRWFFNESACKSAPDDAARSSPCVLSAPTLPPAESNPAVDPRP